MIWLLDNGHGGMINGVYQTEGKRSPPWPDGSQLFEGEFTRAIVARLAEWLTAARVPYVLIAPESQDVPLAERVARANAVEGDTVYLSIHANAGGGRGCEVYTSPGETRSDMIATYFADEYQQAFPGAHFRADHSDGDPDKEAPFYVLTHTRMPAVLTESFFMDNKDECIRYLMSRDGRDRIARAHFDAIMTIEREGVNV